MIFKLILILYGQESYLNLLLLDYRVWLLAFKLVLLAYRPLLVAYRLHHLAT